MSYETRVISANERYFYHLETGRSFFASRPSCSGGMWIIDELDQKEVQGSKSLKVWGRVKKTSDINGYILAIVEITNGN